MADVYEIGKVGSGYFDKAYEHKPDGLDALGHEMERIADPYEIKLGPHDDFGPARSKRNTLDRIADIVDKIGFGQRIIVRGSKDGQPHLMFHRSMAKQGSEVVDAAIAQLGVMYSWADINPKGPQGGPGSGFDCSGLCVWCYGRVGVILPHLSEAIRTNPQVHHFTDRSKIRPGDMVGYHNSDRNGPWPALSHIAICTDKDSQIAAPDFGEVVQRQPIAFGANLVTFMFVPEVTGAH